MSGERSVNDFPHGRLPAAQAFDPAFGRQEIWTGVIGGLFILNLCSAYAVYMTSVLPNGGPMVLDCLSWMPSGYTVKSISRIYFDVMGIVSLSFILMVVWELRKDTVRRAAILLAVFACSGLSWIVALGNKPFGAPSLLFMGWRWTDMEISCALCGAGITAAWASGLEGWRRGAPPWLLRDGP